MLVRGYQNRFKPMSTDATRGLCGDKGRERRITLDGRETLGRRDSDGRVARGSSMTTGWTSRRTGHRGK